MSLKLNSENWVAINLIDAADYSGKTGVTYDDINLVVSYRINGGVAQNKSLALADWSEGTNGGYSVRFSAAECSVAGLLAFEVTYPGCSVYYGAQDITADASPASLPVICSGTIVDGDGQAVPGVMAILTSQLGGSPIATCTTALDGVFSFYLEEGSYYIALQARGYESQSNAVTAIEGMTPLLYTLNSDGTAINYVGYAYISSRIPDIAGLIPTDKTAYDYVTTIISDIEVRINAGLRSRYLVPFDPVPPEITDLAFQMVRYQLYLLAYSQEEATENEWVLTYRRDSEALFKSYVDGTATIAQSVQYDLPISSTTNSEREFTADTMKVW